MSRLFTAILRGGESVADNGDEHDQLIASYVAQEDIKIVGWEQTNYIPSDTAGWTTHDGLVYFSTELTFGAITALNSAISFLMLEVVRTHFGSPAAGWTHIMPERKTITMLPSGEWISMKEGETLNLLADWLNHSGVTLTMVSQCTIFFKKG